MERLDSNAKWMRRSKLATLVVGLLLPFVMFAASKIQTKTAEVAQWLPDASTERQEYDQFREFFGSDLSLVVSWEACDLDDPRVGQFKAALLKRAEQTDPGLIHNIFDSQQLVDELVYGRAGLSLTQARKRLEGAFLGPDGQSVIWIQLSTDSKTSNARIIKLTLDVLKDEIDITERESRLAGSAYHATAIDEASSASARNLIVPASLIAISVAWLFIGQLRLAVIVFGIASISQITGVALVVLSGGTLNAVTIVMPTLIFMLTTSAAVHLVNYFYEAQTAGESAPALAAMRVGLTPVILASLTTAIGLSSLNISKLQPVREFGIYAGSALVLATMILLTTFAFLVFTFSRSKEKPSRTAFWRSKFRQLTEKVGETMANLIIKHSGFFATVGVLTILVGALGVNRLHTSVDLKKMFAEDAKVVEDFFWIENHIAPLTSVEIIVGIPKSKVSDLLDRLRLVRGFENTIEKVRNVKSVTSAITFLPPIPSHRSTLRNSSRKTVFRSEFEKEKQALVDNGLLAERNDVEFWRVSANVDLTEVADRSIVLDIKEACLPYLEKLEDRKVSLEFTGLSPVIYEAQNLLFRDLLVSFMLAFVLITPVMMWILRSIPGGLLVMIPNIAPVAVVFGAMGWLQIPVDIASILTASVALGIAIDDTLHFVTWFKAGQRTGLNRADSVRYAYSKCSTAMFQTTLIFCASLSVFLTAEFLPIRTFSILMGLMLTGALVADLVLLPALLAGSLGRFVTSKSAVSSYRSADSSGLDPQNFTA